VSQDWAKKPMSFALDIDPTSSDSPRRISERKWVWRDVFFLEYTPESQQMKLAFDSLKKLEQLNLIDYDYSDRGELDLQNQTTLLEMSPCISCYGAVDIKFCLVSSSESPLLLRF